MAMVLSGFYVIFPLVRVHPLVSQVNQLTVVLLCSLMIPLRRYNFNEKREETTGFIEALGRRKTRPPQSRNGLQGSEFDSLPSQKYDSWLFHALLHHTAPYQHR